MKRRPAAVVRLALMRLKDLETWFRPDAFPEHTPQLQRQETLQIRVCLSLALLGVFFMVAAALTGPLNGVLIATAATLAWLAGPMVLKATGQYLAGWRASVTLNLLVMGVGLLELRGNMAAVYWTAFCPLPAALIGGGACAAVSAVGASLVIVAAQGVVQVNPWMEGVWSPLSMCWALAGLAWASESAWLRLNARVEDARRVLADVLALHPDGLLKCENGMVTSVNPALLRLLGKSGSLEVVNHALAELLQAVGAPLGALEEGTTLQTWHPGGDRPLQVEVVARQLHSTGADVWLLAVRDVQHREQLLRHVQRTERLAAVGTLASGAAHEINNPLAYVMANMDFVSMVLRAPQPATPGAMKEILEALAEAQHGARRIQSVVRDLGTLVRSAGAADEVIDVSEAAHAAIRLNKEKIARVGRLALDISPGLFAMGAAADLTQVLVNLLANATQALTNTAVSTNLIRVSARAAGIGKVEIQVSDNGPGIPREAQEHVFDPFFTTRRGSGGANLGLGLSICHRLMADLGGSIRLTSDVGVGTTFHLLLRSALQTMPAGTDHPLQASQASSTGRESHERVSTRV